MQALGYQIAPPSWTMPRFRGFPPIPATLQTPRTAAATAAAVAPESGCPPAAVIVPTVLSVLGIALFFPLGVMAGLSRNKTCDLGDGTGITCPAYATLQLAVLTIPTFVAVCAAISAWRRVEPFWAFFSFTNKAIKAGNAFARVQDASELLLPRHAPSPPVSAHSSAAASASAAAAAAAAASGSEGAGADYHNLSSASSARDSDDDNGPHSSGSRSGAGAGSAAGAGAGAGRRRGVAPSIAAGAGRRRGSGSGSLNGAPTLAPAAPVIGVRARGGRAPSEADIGLDPSLVRRDPKCNNAGFIGTMVACMGMGALVFVSFLVQLAQIAVTHGTTGTCACLVRPFLDLITSLSSFSSRTPLTPPTPSRSPCLCTSS